MNLYEYRTRAPEWEVIDLPPPEPVQLVERELTDEEVRVFLRRLEERYGVGP